MTDRPDPSTGRPDREGAAGTREGRWALIVGVSLISMAFSAYEIAPASVTPLIRESMGIGATAAGLVVSVMFATAVVASLPAGAVLDRTNSRYAIAVAVLLLLVVGAWGWFAAERGAFVSLLVSRVLGGAGYVVVWNAGIDIVSESVGKARRATAVGAFTASGTLGFALGQGVGPVAGARFGWPAIFVVFNVLAVLGLAIFWPTSRGLGRVGTESPPSLREIGGLLGDRSILLVVTIGFLGYSVYLFVNSWAPSYLTEEVGLSLGTSGVLAALFPAVGVVSRISSGLLSDRLFGGRRRPVILVSFGIAAPLVAGLAVLESVTVLVGALLGAGFAIQLTLALSYAYVRELAAERITATAVALLTSVGLAGAFAAPIAGGMVIDASDYATAFLLTGAVAGVGMAVTWLTPEPEPEPELEPGPDEASR